MQNKIKRQKFFNSFFIVYFCIICILAVVGILNIISIINLSIPSATILIVIHLYYGSICLTHFDKEKLKLKEKFAEYQIELQKLGTCIRAREERSIM